MQMAPHKWVLTVFPHIFMCFFLCNCKQTDIDCLKSIKDSLEDPFNHLHSWNFNNNTRHFICDFFGVECWNFNDNTIINIQLSNMGLRGEFPRGIRNCTWLTGLNVSYNALSGSIPSDLPTILGFLTLLDLSNNNFSGEIPPSIANMSYLNVLKLNNNRLTGLIPPKLGHLSRIKAFTVANNLLSGPVPQFDGTTFSWDSYVNNDGLCGHPLDPCSSISNKSHVFFICGFAIGYVVAIALVLAGVSYFCMSKLPAAAHHRTSAKITKSGGQRPTKDRRIKEIKISTLEVMVTRMSFNELHKATDKFSENNIIGMGNMGTLYKAMLPSGWFLAVKRIQDSQLFKQQLASELMTLGRLRHSNLVPILGFCIEKKEWFLVYKYMSNGSLYDLLHPIEVGTSILKWPLRVKIAVGIARGLAWLHHYCNVRIAHLNMGSYSVLLDSKFEPKISNFWGALFMNPDDTNSAMDLIVNGDFLELCFVKKDVHGFGIVLLELITGQDPSKLTSSQDNLDWITYSSGFIDAIDKSLMGQGFDDEIYQCLRVALNCIQPIAERRPTMLEVYKMLKGVGNGNKLTATQDSELLAQTENW